jgi:hypothetical protein
LLLFLLGGASPFGIMSLVFEGRRFESSDFGPTGLRRYGASPATGSDDDDPGGGDWDGDSSGGDDE